MKTKQRENKKYYQYINKTYDKYDIPILFNYIYLISLPFISFLLLSMSIIVISRTIILIATKILKYCLMTIKQKSLTFMKKNIYNIKQYISKEKSYIYENENVLFCNFKKQNIQNIHNNKSYTRLIIEDNKKERDIIEKWISICMINKN